jgi:hypothetical protein
MFAKSGQSDMHLQKFLKYPVKHFEHRTEKEDLAINQNVERPVEVGISLEFYS